MKQATHALRSPAHTPCLMVYYKIKTNGKWIFFACHAMQKSSNCKKSYIHTCKPTNRPKQRLMVSLIAVRKKAKKERKETKISLPGLSILTLSSVQVLVILIKLAQHLRRHGGDVLARPFAVRPSPARAVADEHIRAGR